MAGTEGSSDAGDGLREIGAGYLQDIAALRRRDEVSGQNEDVSAPEEER